MAVGSNTTRNGNLNQGESQSVDRRVLVIGSSDAAGEKGKRFTFNELTDFDGQLASDTPLKTNGLAMVKNALPGGSIYGKVCVLADGETWQDVANEEVDNGFIPEVIMLTDVPGTGAKITAIQTLIDELEARGVFVWAASAVRGIDVATQSWSTYQTAMNNLVKDVVAPNVCVIPYITPDALGARMGRVLREDFGLGDPALATKFGPVSTDYDLPEDKDGMKYDNSVATALDAIRLSVVQKYAGKPGIYLADSTMLDSDGGDYEVMEYIRPILKCQRLVHDRMHWRVGDRAINNTPDSLAVAESYALKPLYQMAASRTVGNRTEPGDIAKPEPGDVKIQFTDKNTIRVSVSAQPIDAPKKITNFIYVKPSSAEG